MSVEMLSDLAHVEHFPISVQGEALVDQLRVLRAAGMIEAQLPDAPGEAAWVHGLTGVGRAMLRAHNARQVLALRQQRQTDDARAAFGR